MNATSNSTDPDDVGYWTRNIMVMFFKPNRYFVTCSCEDVVPAVFHWKHCRMFAVEPTLTDTELQVAASHLKYAFDKDQSDFEWVKRDATEC